MSDLAEEVERYIDELEAEQHCATVVLGDLIDSTRYRTDWRLDRARAEVGVLVDALS